MLSEISQICRDLHLQEDLPIKSSSLTEVMIEPPFFATHEGRFATVCTKNTVFGANADSKLSYINKNFRDQDESKYLAAIKKKYLRPDSQIDTNAAYQLATQWLAAAAIDVKALEHDCNVEINPWDLNDGNFVPLYEIQWSRSNETVVAFVKVLEPDHALETLWVTRPEYILRKSLEITNLDYLLSRTNASSPVNIPVTQN